MGDRDVRDISIWKEKDHKISAEYSTKNAGCASCYKRDIRNRWVKGKFRIAEKIVYQPSNVTDWIRKETY